MVAGVSGSDTRLIEEAALDGWYRRGIFVTSWGSLAPELMVDWESPRAKAWVNSIRTTAHGDGASETETPLPIAMSSSSD